MYSHGNAEDLGSIMPQLMELYNAFKVNVCSYEYPGYGLSQGFSTTTEQGVYDCIDAAYAHLQTHYGKLVSDCCCTHTSDTLINTHRVVVNVSPAKSSYMGALWGLGQRVI